MMEMLAMVEDQMEYCERHLAQMAEGDAQVSRLRTVPGIGLVTAMAFIAAIDGAERFGHAHQVEQYLGLVPREQSSGERRGRGHISKAGSPEVRTLLVQAAWSLMHSKAPASAPLQSWALRVAARRGKQIAIVALARKLAGLLFALMRDKTTFEPTHSQKGIEMARKYVLRQKAIAAV
jgi:transposase